MPRPSHRRQPTLTSIAAFALLAAVAAAPMMAARAQDAAGTATLTVTFQNLKSPVGAVFAELLASPEAYDGKAHPADQAVIAIATGTATTTFRNLAPGTYAIRAFHDLNGDGKLNTNPFGIPVEPYAFSNNARGTMGPPPWKAAAFEVKAGDNRQTIDID